MQYQFITFFYCTSLTIYLIDPRIKIIHRYLFIINTFRWLTIFLLVGVAVLPWWGLFDWKKLRKLKGYLILDSTWVDRMYLMKCIGDRDEYMMRSVGFVYIVPCSVMVNYHYLLALLLLTRRIMLPVAVTLSIAIVLSLPCHSGW